MSRRRYVLPNHQYQSKISISTIKSAGPRYGDFKCIHDRTHRVCAKLVDNPTSCNELSWNDNGASFWDITGQQPWNWKDKICSAPNPGDSWCICMWATANLIRAVSYKAGDLNSWIIVYQMVIGWLWQCSYQLCSHGRQPCHEFI